MLHKCLCFHGSKDESSSKKHYPVVVEELCRQFSLADIRKATNNFDEKLLLGKGDYGNVYKGFLEHNGAPDYTVAISLMDCFNAFKKEIELLCQICHPNLISLIGFCNHKHEKIIVYEYTPIGSLHHFMHSKEMGPLSWKKRLEICIGASRGLHYLHSGAKRSIFHRDIKPDMILLGKDLMPKLCNFKLSLQGPLSTSKPKPITADNVVGTSGYIAPEYLLHGTITDKCDVYSFGMVLLQVVCMKDKLTYMNQANMIENQQWRKKAREYSEKLFDDPTSIVILFLKQFSVEEIIDPNLNRKIAPECWEVFMDITQRCLKYEPDERPTMGEVEVLLEHALSQQEQADIRKIDHAYGEVRIGENSDMNGHWRGSPRWHLVRKETLEQKGCKQTCDISLGVSDTQMQLLLIKYGFSLFAYTKETC